MSEVLTHISFEIAGLADEACSILSRRFPGCDARSLHPLLRRILWASAALGVMHDGVPWVTHKAGCLMQDAARCSTLEEMSDWLGDTVAGIEIMEAEQ